MRGPAGGRRVGKGMRMKIHPSFREVAAGYRVVFFDAYGVLKNYLGILEGVPSVLAGLRSAGKDYYVITNDASRSPAKLSSAYMHAEYGDLMPSGKIISSGMLAAEFLAAKVKHGEVAFLGKPDSSYYIETAGLRPIPVSAVTRDSKVRALALLDDEGFHWFQDLNRAVNLLRQLPVPVILANPDLAYPVSRDEVAIAVGSLAGLIEGILGRKMIRFGKPETEIFAYAYELASRENANLEKRDILMVGDTLHTDILGANQFGFDTALVLSGNTRAETLDLAVGSTGILPDFVFESILT